MHLPQITNFYTISLDCLTRKVYTCMGGVNHMETGNLIRADVALTARGLAPSRERAQGLIESGLVRLNGRPLTKSSVKVSEADVLEVVGDDLPYVSRGGFKLERALKSFGIDPAGLTCMDIGASTGGFTDVLLQSGAARVYAIDVGTGQLDARLQSDPRVVSMEHTNARELRSDMFPVQPTLAVMDVSFISIRLILPAAFSVLGERGRMISLIKPQFEAGPKNIGKKGIVSDPKVHIDVLKQIVDFAPTLGWRVRSLDFSPISGGSGNIEFLGDFIADSECSILSPTIEEIKALVQTAHRQVRK